jgi:hypothetical protein
VSTELSTLRELAGETFRFMTIALPRGLPNWPSLDRGAGATSLVPACAVMSGGAFGDCTPQLSILLELAGEKFRIPLSRGLRGDCTRISCRVQISPSLHSIAPLAFNLPKNVSP